MVLDPSLQPPPSDAPARETAARPRAGAGGSTVGQLLRATRETKGLSIATIEGDTKIGRRFLESIEHDDFRRLPGGIYSRAFIRAYARQVGVDPELCVEMYRRQESFHAKAEAIRTHRARRVETLLVAAGAALAALLAIVLWYMYY